LVDASVPTRNDAKQRWQRLEENKIKESRQSTMAENYSREQGKRTIHKNKIKQRISTTTNNPTENHSENHSRE
jgi:hypothetical protein